MWVTGKQQVITWQQITGQVLGRGTGTGAGTRQAGRKDGRGFREFWLMIWQRKEGQWLDTPSLLYPYLILIVWYNSPKINSAFMKVKMFSFCWSCFRLGFNFLILLEDVVFGAAELYHIIQRGVSVIQPTINYINRKYKFIKTPLSTMILSTKTKHYNLHEGNDSVRLYWF